MTDSAFERLKALARSEFYVEGDILPTSTFEGLGLDSLDRVQFAMMCEDELGVAIDDNDMADVFTMGQLADVVERKMVAG